MSKIIGGCVFRDDGNGCLSSKYVNQYSEPFVETCKRQSMIPTSPVPFVGVYDTTWIETDQNGSARGFQNAILTIDINQNQTYSLEWKQNGNIVYEGIGMLYESLLVCGYWSVKP